MTKVRLVQVSCEVEECFHNNSGLCSAESISIEFFTVSSSVDTVQCGTYWSTVTKGLSPDIRRSGAQGASTPFPVGARVAGEGE